MRVPLPLRVVASLALPAGLAGITYWLCRNHYGTMLWPATIGAFVVSLPVLAIAVDTISRKLDRSGHRV